MTKAVKEEKGKVPKSNIKATRDKRRKVLQRREKFPLEQLRKFVRKKKESFGKGEHSFVMDT